MKINKDIVLAYKSRPNDDKKTTYIEYVGIADKWIDREMFMATCELTHFTPFFIHVSKKEWHKIKNDNQAILKKYTDALDELYKKVVDNKTN